jgi:glycine/D-amino acid oxidase-like deaminating enzyme
MGPIERSCFWLATWSGAPEPPLEGRAEADTVVVGAGLTGLWTTIFLKELDPKIDVVLLEQGVAAYGASGRNAGMMGVSIDHSPQQAIDHFGLAEGRLLVELGQQNTREVVDFVSRRQIDCDLELSGIIEVAIMPSHLDAMRADAEMCRQLGIMDKRLLDKEEMQAEIHSPLYLGGFYNPRCGILNPVKLVDGLKQEAMRLGARVHEHTPVTGIETTAAGVRVRSASGEIGARRVILATNAYSHKLLPRLRSRFIPLYDYIIVSTPLDREQRQAIGWQRRQGVDDYRTFFNYYRLTADDRILWGSGDALYHRNNRVDEGCDHSPSHYRALREGFRRHFPALRDLEFPYAWGGPICSTTRFTPFFGAAEKGRILYGLGYTGHGVASTRLGGKILAHMALGRPEPLLDLALVRRKPFPYPPEPLRSLSVRAVTRALRRVDAGEAPSLLLRCLDAMGIGFSS